MKRIDKLSIAYQVAAMVALSLRYSKASTPKKSGTTYNRGIKTHRSVTSEAENINPNPGGGGVPLPVGGGGVPLPVGGGGNE